MNNPVLYIIYFILYYYILYIIYYIIIKSHLQFYNFVLVKHSTTLHLYFYFVQAKNTTALNLCEARGGAVGRGTAPQAGRSRARFPIVSLDFFIDIILPAALWSWV